MRDDVPEELQAALGEIQGRLLHRLVAPLLCFLSSYWALESSINWSWPINAGFVLPFDIQLGLALKNGLVERRRRWFRRGWWLRATPLAVQAGLPSIEDLQEFGQQLDREREADRRIRLASQQFTDVLLDALTNG